MGEKKQIGRLTTGDLEKFIFRDDLAEATQAMYHRQLRTFTRWLRREGHVDVKMPTAFETRRVIPTYLTERELKAVCKKHRELCREKVDKKHVPAEGPTTPLAKLWMADAFRIAFYQGLRLGELVALRVGAVDLKGKRVYVGDKTFIPKGRDEQIITITPPAREIMQRYTESRSPSDLLFSYRSGYRISKAFKAALVKAVPQKADAHFHDLRVSCCVYWLERGVPILDVKDLLRHKSVKTTEKYYRTVVVDSQTSRFESAYGK